MPFGPAELFPYGAMRLLGRPEGHASLIINHKLITIITATYNKQRWPSGQRRLSQEQVRKSRGFEPHPLHF